MLACLGRSTHGFHRAWHRRDKRSHQQRRDKVWRAGTQTSPSCSKRTSPELEEIFHLDVSGCEGVQNSREAAPDQKEQDGSWRNRFPENPHNSHSQSVARWKADVAISIDTQSHPHLRPIALSAWALSPHLALSLTESTVGRIHDSY